MLIVTLLALLAALLFATAAAVQARAARRAVVAEEQRVGALALMRRLLHDPVWLTGWAANLGGFATQAVALHLGSVAVVQPVLVTQLLFTLVLATVGSRRRLTWRDVVGAAGICAGLGLLLSVRGAIPSGHAADRSRLLELAPLVGAAAVLLTAAAAARRGTARAALLGTEAGLFFASSAVLIKLTTDDLAHRGVGATATDWVGYGLALTTALGLVLEQQAFGAGPLAAAMTAMTITNPVVSYAFAVLAFGVPLPSSAGGITAIVVGGVLLCLGTGVLAQSPSVHPLRPAADTPPVRADGVKPDGSAAEKTGQEPRDRETVVDMGRPGHSAC